MKRFILFSLFSIFIVQYNVTGQRIKTKKDNNKLSKAIHTYKKPTNCSPTTAILMQQRDKKPLQNKMLKSKTNKKDTKDLVSAFIKVSADFNNEEILDLDINITSKAGNIFIIVIPIENLSKLALLENIEYIEIGHEVFPKLDNALSDTWVNWVHEGYNLSQSYTGDSVIVGIIDGGFDYTHPMFYDSLYTDYRISRVWEQNDTSGNPPVGYSYGTEIVGQSNLLINKCSDSTGSHGTHVAGIAAGSGSSLSSLYKGVAYNSEIVLVSYKFNSTATFHTNIADGISYIFNYADSIGKPAVINMSLGSHIGSHDGTSLFDEFCDNIVGKGKILVGAAGNEGSDSLHLDYSFGAEETVYSFIEFPGNNSKGKTWIDIWGEEGEDFTIAVNIYNTDAGEYEDYTDCITTTYDSTYSFILEDSDFLNSDECQVEIVVEHSNNQNNKPHIFIYFDNTDQDEIGDIYDYVELEIRAEYTTINAWCSHAGEAIFTDKDYLHPQISGNTDCTIGEIGGTGKSIITVGAYTSKNNYDDFEGNNHDVDYYTVNGEIAPFSSLGTTVDGRIKPDITAPGNVIVSSVNSFDGNYNSKDTTTVANVNNGSDYWWFATIQGTSMASPMAAGIIALWLESKPDLTPEKVKYFMQNNAWTDSYTGTVPNNTWGYGKIDAHETLKALEAAFTISTNISPNLSGNIKGEGVFESGQICDLIATPEIGYNFVNWTEGGTEVSTDSNYSFVVNSSRTLTANFELKSFNITANANPVSGGTVSGAGNYNYNQTANLIATPEIGYNFVNWTEGGTAVSTDSNYSFIVDSSRTLTANFELKSFNITADVNPVSGGSVSGAGNYNYNQTANLIATPEIGYNFVNWTEGGTAVSTDSNYSFIVDSSRTLTANFELKSFNITADVNPVSGGSVSGAGNYNYNQTANLIATPEIGYNFVNWTEGGTTVSTDSNYSFVVSSSRALTANFDELTSSEEINFSNNEIIIYPNPTNDLLYIKFQGDIKPHRIIVSDITGMLLIKKTLIHKTESINLSNFNQGIFIINIETNKGNYKQKIIKE